MAEPPSLFAELKRRRVFRALIGYGLAAFAVLQIIEPVMHGLHWPDAVLTYVVVGLALGFPLTVCLAWIFDINAGRIERTPATQKLHPRLVLWLVTIGILAAAPAIAWYVFRTPVKTSPESAGGPRPAADPSVAVLPFVNLSSDKEQEYFSDGVAEEILNALTQVEGLRVIGRTSSFSFKGKHEDLRTVGEKLGVAHLLEGSVRKAANRVRVTAQLVEAAGGSQLWSQVFEREPQDIFAVQDEIAHAVVAALRVKLLPGRASVTKELRTANPEVYNQYLLGRHLQSQFYFDAFVRAAEAYRKALAIDPKYAPAWAGLAITTVSLADNSTTSPAEMQEAGRRALEYAEKAVALAPDAVDGYAARGSLLTQLGFDFTSGRRDLERALELSPNDPRALRNLVAGVLLPLAQLPEGLAAASRAARLDPLDSGAWVLLGRVQLYAGDLTAARASAERALQISPANTWAEWTLAEIDLAEGKAVSALARAQKFRDERNRLALAALAEQKLGHLKESQQALEAFAAAGGHQWPYVMAELFADRGAKDEAFEWLERARTQHDLKLKMIKVDPYLRGLRNDPRYPALLGKLNLPLN